MVRRFLIDRSGATAIEYALLAAVLALLVVSAAHALAPAVSKAFQAASAALAGDDNQTQPRRRGS